MRCPGCGRSDLFGFYGGSLTCTGCGRVDLATPELVAGGPPAAEDRESDSDGALGCVEYPSSEDDDA